MAARRCRAASVAVVGLASPGLAGWNLRARSPPPESPERFVISASPECSAQRTVQTAGTGLAMSRDGRLIAYRATVNGDQRVSMSDRWRPLRARCYRARQVSIE